MRLDLVTPEGDVLTHDGYNRTFTLHGVIMVWFFLIPSIPSTFGNFLIPLMIGAKDLAAQLFFNLYFASTRLHAIHFACGLGAVLVFICLTVSARAPLPAKDTRIEILGMYWHLVDIVWIFLYPVLYLI